MQNIKLGHLYRVYLLYGEEKYLKEMYLKKLVKLAAPQGLEEFNLHRFDAGQMEVDDLIESCEALPMMAQQRCVVVEKFDFESLNAQDKAKVTELLEDPPETTVLLLVVDKEDFLPKKSASAKKLVALCDKAGAVQATRHFAGAIDSKWQKEAGVETDKGKLLNELTRYASGKCSQDVWKVWINESGETFEYVHDIMAAAGMDIYLDTDGYDHPTGGTDFYVPPQQHMWYLPDVADAAPPCPLGQCFCGGRILPQQSLGRLHRIQGQRDRVRLYAGEARSRRRRSRYRCDLRNP